MGKDARTAAPSLAEELMRPDIATLEEYHAIVPFDVLSARLGLPQDRIVKLDANENPYGPSPRALEAIAAFPHHHIYPDPQQTALRQVLSAYVGVPKENILAGSGSDELLDLLCRLFVFPGDAVVTCPPTFGMYRFDALLQGARVVEVPRHDDFSLRMGEIERACLDTDGMKLLFLASPNNPDGSRVSRQELLRLLALPVVVVVDEAYAEFSGESYVDMVGETGNLVVLRTFSKWAGLAGLRIGYGIFPEPILRNLWKIKQPYNVNTAASAAAIASLDDVAWLKENVHTIVMERERLQSLLKEITFLRPYPSHSNFILCRVVERDAFDLQQRLERRGILVRYFSTPGLRDHIRISVGRPEHTDALLDALKEE